MGRPPAEAEAALRAVASRQQFVFTRAQARSAGFSRRQIERRLSTKEWLLVYRAVFRPAFGATTPVQRIVAAWLAAGVRAVVSHLSAAILWGLDVPTPADPEITLPHERRCRVQGILIRRTTTFRRGDVAVRHGLRVTTPLRTLIDLAAVLDEASLEDVLDDAIRKRLVDLASLSARMRRAEMRKVAGTRVLRRLLAVRTGGAAIGGRLETRFFRLVRRARLPVPVRQHRVTTRHGRRRIDFAYVRERVAVEVRDYDSHTRREVFDDDPVRREDLEELGWRVVEVTWTQIERTPDEVVMRIARALGLEAARWRSTASARR